MANQDATNRTKRVLPLVGLTIIVLSFLAWLASEQVVSDPALLPEVSAGQQLANEGEPAVAELASQSDQSKRRETTAEISPEESSLGEVVTETESSTGNLRDLLAGIRSAAGSENPHAQAWPHVQILASAVGDEALAGGEKLIATELEELLRSPGRETAFVRGAILLALGMTYPPEAKQELALKYQDEPSGEVARAAWLLPSLSPLGGIDLGQFDRRCSAAVRSIWPVTISSHPEEETVQRALAQLTPPDLYLVAFSNNRNSPEGKVQALDGKLTREVIVLSSLAGAAQRPGPIRDTLLSWARNTDMSRACIWSLCLAAKDDDGLAQELYNLMVSLGLSSQDGSLVARLLVVLSGRATLVFEYLETTFTDLDAVSEGMPPMEQLNALFALGEILELEDSALSGRVADLLISVALRPDQGDTLRVLALGQLSAVLPERLPDALESLLLSPESPQILSMAAVLAKFTPPEHHQIMRDRLLSTYTSDLPIAVQDSYVSSLVSLGGEDVRPLLHTILQSGQIGDSARSKALAFLGLPSGK